MTHILSQFTHEKQKYIVKKMEQVSASGCLSFSALPRKNP